MMNIEHLFEILSSFSVDRVILLIMMLFLIVGGVDRILGNKFGYGEKFENGFQTVGGLMLAISGIYAMTPVITKILEYITEPLFEMFHIDPGILPGVLLASDMGGYSIAMSLSKTESIGQFSGILLGGTVGTVWLFLIPVAMSIIRKEDYESFTLGIMAGLISVPAGCFAGAVVMKFMGSDILLSDVFRNLVPVIVFCAVICVFLFLMPRRVIKVSLFLAKGILLITTVITVMLIIEMNLNIIQNSGMRETVDIIIGRFEESFVVCGRIGVILAGAFPMVEWVNRHCKYLLEKIGKVIRINQESSSGFLASIANPILMMKRYASMDQRGKIINAAFAVGGSFAFGDLLAFTAGVDTEMIFPLLITKMTCGLLSIIIAILMIKKSDRKVANSSD